MIELLLPCGFDTLEYSWVKDTIGICTLADYSMDKKRQQTFPNIFCSRYKIVKFGSKFKRNVCKHGFHQDKPPETKF
jgi:hypothetical protein